ncbi:MAG TPA: M23 family metallopeptidase [Nitrospirota bacterium]|nr:M23 family metallopeptidase [Nitrospirota bacterium]
MKRLLIIFLTVCIAASTAFAGSSSKPQVILSPKKIGPGDIMLVTVRNAKGPVEGTFAGKKLLFSNVQGSSKAIVGIDLLAETGKYDLDVSAGARQLHRVVTVVKKKYPVQRLTLPKDMVELSPENEARVERDQKKFAALWPNQTDRTWNGNFINPREGEVVTKFGVRRIINNIPKNPHTGIDVSAEEGDEVRAPNSGVVALVDDMFYSGNSIVLDHGQGIYTMFFHLSKTLVTAGQAVKKGEAIGLVGSTGRSTGAHLHWGARVQGARVDPMQLIQLRLE